ncbi:MAG TPA: hypothetical protein VMF32_04265 [Xanthobacteraceae bacterium]|nr:hypothetical protein [Xanthobacteraceae bacterium]
MTELDIGLMFGIVFAVPLWTIRSWMIGVLIKITEGVAAFCVINLLTGDSILPTVEEGMIHSIRGHENFYAGVMLGIALVGVVKGVLDHVNHH